MSAPPADWLAAVEAVSWTVPCIQCGCTLEVAYDADQDRVIIRHLVRHTLGAGAAALGWFIICEISALVSTAEYDEYPIHTVPA
jgi:hypothetical protein